MVAEVTVKEFVMSASEIETRLIYAGSEKVIRIYVSDGGDPIYNNKSSTEPLTASRKSNPSGTSNRRWNMAG